VPEQRSLGSSLLFTVAHVWSVPHCWQLPVQSLSTQQPLSGMHAALQAFMLAPHP
jgi:hypothetical protein